MFRRLIAVLVFVLLVSGAASAQDAVTLTGRALENVSAFARLLGYVRYFHPSDAAASTDWEQFAIAHVESIEAAETPEMLAEQLMVLFAPYAPTVQVFPAEAEPELPAALEMPNDDEALLVTQWVHVAHRDQDGQGSIHPSERIFIRVEDGVLPETFAHQAYVYGIVDIPIHNPAQPYEADLGGGVTARIPLALYASDVGTLPATTAPESIPMQQTDAESRPARLAAVILGWAHFQHLFAYWDVLEAQGIDWQAVLSETLTNAADDETEREFLDTLKQMIAYLNDGHAGVWHPDHPDIPVGRNELPGVLPLEWDMIEGQLTVVQTWDGAESIQVGDVITAINGEPVASLLAREDALTSFVGQWGIHNILFYQRYDAVGSSVTLDVLPLTGEAYTTTLTRVQNMDPQLELLYVREPRPPMVAELAPGVIYVDVTRLTLDQYAVAVDTLANAEALIFDMRGYPIDEAAISLLGHLSDTDLSSAPFLVPVITSPDHQAIDFADVTEPSWAPRRLPRFTDNVAFLINGNGAVSHAESIMGIVEGYELGAIVGTPTAGANGTLATLDLPGGYGVSWTSLRVTKFDGSPLFTQGVTPTIPVERTRAGVAAGRDEILEAGFRAVGGGALDMSAITEMELDTRVTDTLYAQMDALLPAAWQQIEPGTFTPNIDLIVIGAAVERNTMSETVEDVLSLMPANADVNRERMTLGRREWEFFTITVPEWETHSVIAVAEEGEFAFTIYLDGSANEVEVVRENVFIPLLAALDLDAVTLPSAMNGM